jgi:cyclophilin family peptidyl-prolyl cis-trans isomerase
MSSFMLLGALALAPAHPAATQGEPARPPAAEPGAAAAADPAAEAFRPLRREFDRLRRSVENLGTLDDRGKALVASFRDRVIEFAGEWPNHAPAAAMVFQLTLWLDDLRDDRVEQLMRRIGLATPPEPAVLAIVGDYFNRRNDYPATIELLAESGIDFTRSPRAALALSSAHFAEHHFTQAVELLETIPIEVREKDSRLNREISTALATRKQYVDFWAQEQITRNLEIAADNLPHVELLTSRGRIVVELFENEAPNTVANFISLVESGYYAQTKFHRVIPNFMAQGGDEYSKPGSKVTPGAGNPGYRIADECKKPEARKHFSGSLSMANSGPDTGGSQFFLTHLPTTHLNGRHTVFGVVLEGLDVVRAIELNDELQAVNVLRKRDHEYVPEKLPLTPIGGAAPSAGSSTPTTSAAIPPSLGTIPLSITPPPPTTPGAKPDAAPSSTPGGTPEAEPDAAPDPPPQEPPGEAPQR